MDRDVILDGLLEGFKVFDGHFVITGKEPSVVDVDATDNDSARLLHLTVLPVVEVGRLGNETGIAVTLVDIANLELVDPTERTVAIRLLEGVVTGTTCHHLEPTAGVCHVARVVDLSAEFDVHEPGISGVQKGCQAGRAILQVYTTILVVGGPS